MGPFLPACHLLHIIQDFSVWGMKEPPLASALACAIFVDWNFDSSHQLMCIRTMYETRGAIFSPCTSHFKHRYLTMSFTVANTLVACVFICFLRSWFRFPGASTSDKTTLKHKNIFILFLELPQEFWYPSSYHRVPFLPCSARLFVTFCTYRTYWGK